MNLLVFNCWFNIQNFRDFRALLLKYNFLLRIKFLDWLGILNAFLLDIKRLRLPIIILRLSNNLCIYFLIEFLRLINFNNDIWTYSPIVCFTTNLNCMRIDNFCLIVSWFTCILQDFLLFYTLRFGGNINFNYLTIFIIDQSHHFLCILLGQIDRLQSNLIVWFLKLNWINACLLV